MYVKRITEVKSVNQPENVSIVGAKRKVFFHEFELVPKNELT